MQINKVNQSLAAEIASTLQDSERQSKELLRLVPPGPLSDRVKQLIRTQDRLHELAERAGKMIGPVLGVDSLRAAGGEKPKKGDQK